MSDRVVVAITEDGKLRARATQLRLTLQECLIRCLPGRGESELLSRGLALVAVYPTAWKADDRIAFRWQGTGDVQTLICQMAKPGTLRAAVSPRRWPDEPMKSPDGILGAGMLTVIVERKLQVHARSETELSGGSLDDDVVHFFTQSVQTPTRLASASRISDTGLEATAAAVLVQCLPGTEPEELPPVERFVIDPSAPPRVQLDRVFDGRPYEILEEHPLSFLCPCSRERLEGSLQLLTTDELRDMIATDGGAKARCEFCKDLYAFSAEELQALVDARDSGEK